MWKTPIPTTATAKSYAREHRGNPTPAENLMWQKLRCKRICGVRFHRQKAKLHYILDFYCPKAKLCVEIDGSTHDPLHDTARDGHLKHYGIMTLRFTNRQVFEETGKVLAAIHETVSYRCATLNTKTAVTNAAASTNAI